MNFARILLDTLPVISPLALLAENLLINIDIPKSHLLLVKSDILPAIKLPLRGGESGFKSFFQGGENCFSEVLILFLKRFFQQAPVTPILISRWTSCLNSTGRSTASIPITRRIIISIMLMAR